ncbi:nucleotidyltransferase domain-containing protein [Ignisphaera sp. 4213-co]|uniref:Nucleotidyltransferase domain-containing protein n=1 Tax=Ignisphaera cupida TaxID=3050454 RepID=A0ABD4Z4Q8_9CREN|nr:nucleotidyltransferase domain-containing protein [Ignisphaera sp. 4213-co]MDK6027885.1 nucleotidyltransferase domain-containing protein [Ignisphaera sp. 4213-co]
MEIVEERIKIREKLLEKAQRFAECVLQKLSNSTIVVFGSVARGDFNEWSDVDVLIVTRDDVPTRPVDRLDVVYECMKRNPIVEPVIITYNEFMKLLTKNNPLVIEALEKGIVFVDKLSLITIYSSLKSSVY